MNPTSSIIRGVITTIIISTVLTIAFIGFASSSTKEIKRLNKVIKYQANLNDVAAATTEYSADLEHVNDSLIKVIEIMGGPNKEAEALTSRLNDTIILLQTLRTNYAYLVDNYRIIERERNECLAGKNPPTNPNDKLIKNYPGAKQNFVWLDSLVGNCIRQNCKGGKYYDMVREFFKAN